MSAKICCTGSPERERENPPGQAALSYRIGTWSTFRASLVSGLARQRVPPEGAADAPRPLAALTTRAAEDGTIALLDAWACVCDVLTFYQERIANETYLGTAIEKRSVAEIASSLGYEPDPGVAASVALAFTIDENDYDDVSVPARLRVLSIPEDGKQPVAFETAEALEALADWNSFSPRATKPHPIVRGTTELYLAGVGTRLAVGDPIVVLGKLRDESGGVGVDASERWDLRFVRAVELVAGEESYTIVTLDQGLGDKYTKPAATDVRVFTFRERGGLFGWNAPDARLMSSEIQSNAELIVGKQWKNFKLSQDQTRLQLDTRALDLDREYASVVKDGWICLQSAIEAELYKVTRANPASRTEFSMSARVTRVFVDSDEHLDVFSRRGTTIFLGSVELPIAERPDDDPVSGYSVELDREVADPPPIGRVVLVTGTAVDTGEDVVIETAVDGWASAGGKSTIALQHELPELERASVRILGNVVAATHGASVADEAIGSGAAGASHQEMKLRNAPLTWTPAPPSGSASSLDLRVDGVLWERVDTLYNAGPRDRVYTLRLDPEGQTVVGFGDGLRGARLPSGVENVRATYRRGIGLEGEVAGGSLELLQTRPLGVRAVTNPAAPVGGADADDYEMIRVNAPLTVLTLDRLVSLSDYEDFAGSFPGIGKARAVELWDGRRGFVHLTVASASGEELAETGATIAALKESIAALQDPGQHAIVAGHEERPFGVELKVLVDAAFVEADVLQAVTEAIVAAFAFGKRAFGQPVSEAEVVTIVQAVEGVVAVDVDALARHDGFALPGHPSLIPAALPIWDGLQTSRAELLIVDPESIDVRGMEDA